MKDVEFADDASENQRIFNNGRSVDEGNFHASRVEKLHPMLTQMIGTYVHLDQSFQ